MRIQRILSQSLEKADYQKGKQKLFVELLNLILAISGVASDHN